MAVYLIWTVLIVATSSITTHTSILCYSGSPPLLKLVTSHAFILSQVATFIKNHLFSHSKPQSSLPRSTNLLRLNVPHVSLIPFLVVDHSLSSIRLLGRTVSNTELDPRKGISPLRVYLYIYFIILIPTIANEVCLGVLAVGVTTPLNCGVGSPLLISHSVFRALQQCHVFLIYHIHTS